MSASDTPIRPLDTRPTNLLRNKVVSGLADPRPNLIDVVAAIDELADRVEKPWWKRKWSR